MRALGWVWHKTMYETHDLEAEVCSLLCVNDEEKSGVVVDNSCVFWIILNSVLRRPEACTTCSKP